MNDAHAPLDTRLHAMMRGGALFRCIFNGIPSPALVEMCAFAGFDAVLIDNEHGSSSFESTENMLRAARASGVPALVRCLEQDIARTLDLGPSGVQIPMVSTAEH
ncbi:MAG: 4-hydroxy-2-oxovalerate aldolase, partial [Rhodoferax sp.]|nr:4-hydroxy-2-oxovalerate aldolase [Rhodoferax sp.]